MTSILTWYGFLIKEKNDYSKSDVFVILLVIMCMKQPVLGFLKTKFRIKNCGKMQYVLGIEVLEKYTGIYFSKQKHCFRNFGWWGASISTP